MPQLPVEPQAWALALVASRWPWHWRWSAVAAPSAASRLLVLLPRSGLGFCLLPHPRPLFGTAMLARPAYGTFEARVDEIVSAQPRARRMIVSDSRRLDDDRPVPMRRARLVVPPEPPLAPGDIIRASCGLLPVPGRCCRARLTGSSTPIFDGIGAYGTVRRATLHWCSTGTSFDPTRVDRGVCARPSAQRIDAVLEATGRGIGRAMMMGDQSAITDEAREVMAASGLAHVYSVSGLHLSIVAGGMFWLVRLLLALPCHGARRWPVKKIAAVWGIVAAAGYMLLAGGMECAGPALDDDDRPGLRRGAGRAARADHAQRRDRRAAIIADRSGQRVPRQLPAVLCGGRGADRRL